MRNKFAEVFYNLIKKNKNIRLVAADISPSGKLAELSKKYPKKFINVGVAESSMISMCAGLAMRGLVNCSVHYLLTQRKVCLSSFLHEVKPNRYLLTKSVLREI